MKDISGVIFLHLVVYLIGSLFAWDWNPLHWWIFKSSSGRILFLIFEMIGFFKYLLED